MYDNYPAGVTDMDEHFNLPSDQDDEDLYGLVLDVHDGQPMGMPVFDKSMKPLALTLVEIKDLQRAYTERNPKGLYSIVPLERIKRMEELGITEQDIEETRYPTHWPE